MDDFAPPSLSGYFALLPGLPPPSRGATRAEKRRYWRDILIYLARRQGLTHEFLAEAFSLSVNSVRNIVYKLAMYGEESEVRRGRHLCVLPLPDSVLLRGTAHAKKRGRARRDLLICLAHQHGWSQRSLAEVFDLPRSWIATIVTAGHGDEMAVRGDRPSHRRPGRIPGP
jgi:hypothetical protein